MMLFIKIEVFRFQNKVGRLASTVFDIAAMVGIRWLLTAAT